MAGHPATICKHMKTAVVILNWNGLDYLRQFLPAVIRHSSEEIEVVVADNASTDGSNTFLRENHPEVRLIENPENWGFARGYNEALRLVDTEYYVLLNSDVEVTADWIRPVIDLMDRDPSIAACQPKIRSHHDREHFEYAGAAGGFIDHLGYPFCRGRIFDALEEDRGQYDDAIEIFWATGACLFVRAKVFHEMGGFDDDFFAHMEEIDLCWRMKNAGYKVMYCPTSTVFHVGGGTLPKHSPRKTYLNFRNNLFMLVKNLPALTLAWVLAIRLLLDAFSAALFLLKRQFGDAGAVGKAYIDLCKAMSGLRRKRVTIRRRRTGQIYQRSIVMEYYLKRKRTFSTMDHDRFSRSDYTP